MRCRAGPVRSGFSCSPAKEEGSASEKGAPEDCRGGAKGPQEVEPGPSGWGASYGEAAPIVWLGREESHLSFGVSGPVVSERGVYVCTLFLNTKIRTAQSMQCIVNRLDKR